MTAEIKQIIHQILSTKSDFEFEMQIKHNAPGAGNFIMQFS